MQDGLPSLEASTATIRSALMVIDAHAVSIALLVDPDARLVGIVTDGDVRRALLSGASLDQPVAPFVTRNPMTVSQRDSRAQVLDLMLSRSMTQIPVVDDQGRLSGLHTLRSILGRESKSIPALILAGGRGSRLGHRTAQTPKPMMRVAGRPIVERLIDHLVGYGIHNITLSVAYLSEVIIDYLGDGSDRHCTIDYLIEDPLSPRGTGGPVVDFVRSRSSLPGSLLVLNGDLVTDINMDWLLSEHSERGADMTIGTHSHTQEIPYGVVRKDNDGWVAEIQEKPVLEFPVNAGIYVLNPEVVKQFPDQGEIPMTDIVEACLRDGGRVWPYSSSADWADVGTPSDLAQARGLLNVEDV